MSYIIPPNREWTPALAAQNEPPILDLEDDYEHRLAFSAERYRLVVGLGGISVEVKTDSIGIRDYLVEALGPFLEESEPQVRLAIGAAGEPFPLRTLIGTMMTYTRGPRVIGKFREMAGYIDTATGLGRGLVASENFRQNMLNYLRLVVDAMTPRLAAMLFHTAGVARNGHAYLFFGQATAGKSTLTRLAARRYEIMTDDMLVLRLDQGVTRAATCGFWGGETKDYPTKRIDLPVKALFRLRKGATNTLRRLDPAAAAFEVVCGIPSMVRPKSDYRGILDMASEVASRVPFYELQFHKNDDSFWSVIDASEP